MDLLHRGAGVFHRVERFLVYVGGFDAVDLLLDLGDLRGGLFEGALVDFFAAEGCFGGYREISLVPFNDALISKMSIYTCIVFGRRGKCRDVPVLLLVMFFLASASCSAI